MNSPLGLDPVIQYHQFCSELATAGGINSGLLLRGIRSSGKVTDSLCESRISRIYKHLARKANIQEQTVREISSHSMQGGVAHDQLNHGASLPQIMIRGGWAETDTVMRYIERVHPSRPPYASDTSLKRES